MAENIFGMLKSECLKKHEPQSITHASRLIDNGIFFYNQERIQIKAKLTPRSPRGERHRPRHAHDAVKVISIHAPRGGSDHDEPEAKSKARISIHAPRGGSDISCKHTAWDAIDFNPRSPRGERRRSPC